MTTNRTYNSGNRTYDSFIHTVKEYILRPAVVIVEKATSAGQGDTAKTVAGIRNTFTSEVNRLLSETSIDFYKHVQEEVKFYGYGRPFSPVDVFCGKLGLGFLGFRRIRFRSAESSITTSSNCSRTVTADVQQIAALQVCRETGFNDTSGFSLMIWFVATNRA